MIARLRITYKLENTENFEGLKTYTLDFICACTEKGIYVCILRMYFIATKNPF